MTSPKNLSIALLALLTLGIGALAWKQHQELVVLRAAALSPTERADWQKRVWAAEKQKVELEKKAAALAEKDASAEPAEPAGTPPQTPPPFRGRANFAAMMENPEIQRLLAVQNKAALDARYSSLFKSLNLTPQQLDQFKNLLVEKSTAMMDVLAAARAQGISPRSDRAAFQQLVSNAQADIDNSIRSTIGDAAFSQYQQYEATLPQRSVVGQLEQRLSYSSTPLSQTQAEQLVQIMASTSPASPGSNSPRALMAGAVGAAFGGRGGPGAPINDATVSQAAGVLAGPQVDALKQLQQEQQAQAALAAAFRAQVQAGRNAGGTAPAPAPRPGG